MHSAWLALSMLLGASSEAAPRAPSDLNISRLFHAFAGVSAFVNRLPGSAKTLPPYLLLTQSMPLNHGVSQLNSACSVRTLTPSSDHSSPFNQILETTPTQELTRDTRYSFNGMHQNDHSFTAVFKNEKATPPLIEISCSHPELNTWTVSHFESALAGLVEVRVYAESMPKNAHPPVAVSRIQVKDFHGSWINGFFGSGLPGTVGVQLMMGTDLKAFREPASAPIVRGRRCTLTAQESIALDSTYQKDSRFGFLGYKVMKEDRSVELVFDNWNYSPHQIRVQCHGSEAEVLAMNSAEIERDLNGAVHFYQK